MMIDSKLNLFDKLDIIRSIDKYVFDIPHKFDTNQYVTIINLIDLLVKQKRVLIKDVFSAINHDLDYSSDDSDLNRLYQLIKQLEFDLGNESVMYNTILRFINGYTQTTEELKLNTEFLDAPAYDNSLVSVRYDELEDLRLELYDFVRNGDTAFMNQLRELMRTTRIDRRPVMLVNGSSQDEFEGFDMNDILSQMLFKESWNFVKVLDDYFHIKEDYEHIPNYSKHDISISYIPDSNQKIRVIYRIHAYLARRMKAVHRDLDAIARDLDGNATYDQTGWLINLVKLGYNKTKVIVSTDMTKYSDTLQMDFLKQILRLRYPDNVVECISHLYQLTAYDSRHGKYYEEYELKSSLQGLYSDFPLITMANLIVQDFIYFKLGYTHSNNQLINRNCAVGDDSGMVFDDLTSELIPMITDCYNCVGVNINMEKTHILSKGFGFIDFVKLKLTSKDIGWSFSGTGLFEYPRSTIKDDVFYRDICNLYNNLVRLEQYDRVERLRSFILQDDRLNFLINVSIINGGLKDSPIDQDDIKLFLYRMFDSDYQSEIFTTKQQVNNALRTLRYLETKLDIRNSILKELLEPDTDNTVENIEMAYIHVLTQELINVEDPSRIVLEELIGKDPKQIRSAKLRDLSPTELVIRSHPLVPSFGKTKRYNVYSKLREVYKSYKWRQFDLNFRFYDSGKRRNLELEDIYSNDYAKTVNWTKLKNLILNWGTNHNCLISKCVFGNWYYYLYVDHHTYIVGLHPYSCYDCVPDSIIWSILTEFGVSRPQSKRRTDES